MLIFFICESLMASEPPCVNSRWDQVKPKADGLPGAKGSRAVTAAAGVTESRISRPEPPQRGVEMAAAMAAKINAMLMAKGKLKPLQPLPSKVLPAAPPPPPVCTDDVIVAEVDINDVSITCRNLLTKGRTQSEIRQFSGAVVSTKGLHMGDAEKCSSTSVARPLYLHVQGRSQAEVNKAVARIKEIISEDVLRRSDGLQPPVMPTVPVYRQPAAALPTNSPTIPAHKPPPPHSGSFVHTKIFVGLDQSHPSFNVNERVEGPSGSYLQHIQSETGARVFLRGKGSGYMEQASRRESFEPLYLYISHPNAAGLEAARKLCENLLETVRAEHARVMSSYSSSASAPVYSPHTYSTNSGYSSQSWYSYPYPASAGFWNNSSSGANSQSQLSSPVQYPVLSRKPAAFTPQDEDAVSDGADSGCSPKRLLSEEQQNTQEACADVSVEVRSDAADRSSERILMPPPAAPVTSGRKRPREEAFTDEQMMMMKMKPAEDPSSSSGLVPYGGDSSDEEEERTRSSSRTAV